MRSTRFSRVHGWFLRGLVDEGTEDNVLLREIRHPIGIGAQLGSRRRLQHQGDPNVANSSMGIHEAPSQVVRVEQPWSALALAGVLGEPDG